MLQTDEAKLFETERERRGAAAVLAGSVHRAGRVQAIGTLTGSRTSRAGDPIHSGEVRTMPLQSVQSRQSEAPARTGETSPKTHPEDLVDAGRQSAHARLANDLPRHSSGCGSRLARGSPSR